MWTPELEAEYQALKGSVSAPSNPVANTPVGQIKTFETNLATDAAGKQTYAKTIAKAEAEKVINAPKEDAQKAATLRDLEMAAQQILDARSKVGGSNWFEAGIMGDQLKGTAGTPAYRLDQALNPVRGNVAVSKMAELKANSPTGSTGFGALSEKELALLERLKGSTEVGLGEDELQNNLRSIYEGYANSYRTLSGGKELRPYEDKEAVKLNLRKKYGL